MQAPRIVVHPTAEVIPFRRPKQIKNKKRSARRAPPRLCVVLSFPAAGRSLAEAWQKVVGVN
jgi:hypothetical protein